MSRLVNQSSVDENIAIFLQFGSSGDSEPTITNDYVIAREIQEQYENSLMVDDAAIALQIHEEESCVHSQLNDDDEELARTLQDLEACAHSHLNDDDEELARTLQDLDVNLQPSLSDDENLARYLQEVEESASITDGDVQETHQHEPTQVNHSYAPQPDGPTTRTSPNSSPISSQNENANENTDPNDMTYEELNELEESIGDVSRGLSDERISQLRTHKYGNRTRMRCWHFKKKKFVATDTECSICLVDYEKGDKITTLPCNHIYHKACISHWLRENNVCCVCKAEV